MTVLTRLQILALGAAFLAGYALGLPVGFAEGKCAGINWVAETHNLQIRCR